MKCYPTYDITSYRLTALIEFKGCCKYLICTFSLWRVGFSSLNSYWVTIIFPTMKYSIFLVYLIFDNVRLTFFSHHFIGRFISPFLTAFLEIIMFSSSEITLFFFHCKLFYNRIDIFSLVQTFQTSSTVTSVSFGITYSFTISPYCILPL